MTLIPGEVFLPGTNLEMAFDDTQVDQRIADHGKQGAGFHLVNVMEEKLELLLVDGRRSQQGGFKSGFESVGDFPIGLIELFQGLQRVLDTLVCTVA